MKAFVSLWTHLLRQGSVLSFSLKVARFADLRIREFVSDTNCHMDRQHLNALS